jgi:DNA integrity scanning protein DisA with diadenylate cyclase activity
MAELSYHSIQNDINELKDECNKIDIEQKELINHIEKIEERIITYNTSHIITTTYTKLENLIMRDITGLSNYKLYHINNIKNIIELLYSPKFTEKCNEYFKIHNITTAHISILNHIINNCKIIDKYKIIHGKDFSLEDALNNELMTFKDLSIIVAEYEANITNNNIGPIIEDLFKLMDYYGMD